MGAPGALLAAVLPRHRFLEPAHAVLRSRLDGAKITSLSAAVPNLSDEQITARIDLFIGALGGGHDLFWPVYPERGAMLPFALKVYLFTDGLYIIDAYDPELIGSRIDFFGETPAAAAYETVANAFPGDNDMEARWMGVRHLTQAYTLEALGIIDNARTATLTVTDNAKDTMHFWAKNPGAPVWYGTFELDSK